MTFPFENDTNRIVSQLAYADLDRNKLKKRLSLLAITLATILITMSMLLPIGADTMNKKRENPYIGYYHGLIGGASLEQVEAIKTHPSVEEIGVTTTVGISKSEDSTLNIIYGDKNALEYTVNSIEEGLAPRKSNEIAIEKDYLRKLGLSAGIGDEITLSYTEQMTVKMVEKTFVISGFLETSASGTSRAVFGAVVSEAYMLENKVWDRLLATVLYCVGGENSFSTIEIEELVIQVAKDTGFEEEPFINEGYLNFLNPKAAYIMGMIVLIAIVMISGALVIYCIFYIAIVNQIKQYGQLSTLGMTGKQLKKMLYKEVGILSTISIPLGVLIGTAISYLLLPKGFAFNNLVWCIPIAMVLTYLTVRFSLMKPASALAKIAPIESTKYIGKLPSPKSSKKAAEFFNKIGSKENFIEAKDRMKKLSPLELAKNQNKKNRKQNLITVISISFIGILLIFCATILSSADVEIMTKNFFPRGEDYSIDRWQKIQEENVFTEEIMNELMELEGLVKITVDTALPYTNDHQNEDPEESLASFLKEDESFIETHNTTGEIPSYQEMIDNNYLIVSSLEHFKNEYGYIPKQGQKIELKIFDGLQSKIETFEIVGVLKEKTSGRPFNRSTFAISKDAIERLVSSNSITLVSLEFEPEQVEIAGTAIADIFRESGEEDNVYISSYNESLQMNETMMLGLTIALTIVMIFLGGFASINLGNTIIASIIVRKRELAMMEAVGMTYRQVRKMVYYENLMIVLKGVVSSLVFGSLIGAIACLGLKESGQSFITYQYPWLATMIFSVIAILITLMFTHFTLHSSEKLPLTERIRN